jgi:hypothetical protein
VGLIHVACVVVFDGSRYVSFNMMYLNGLNFTKIVNG